MDQQNNERAGADSGADMTMQNSQKQSRQTGRYLLTAVVSVIVTFALTVSGGMLLYLSLGHQLPAFSNAFRPGTADLSLDLADDEATQAALAKFQSVYSAIDQNYYKDLSDAEMLEAMTRGLVNEMDSPYTMYLDAQATQEIADSMSGNYVGIGAIVAYNISGYVEITEIIPESPAEQSGLQVGDIFMSVNGESVEGIQDTNALAVLVRGEEGTSVELEMYRPLNGETLTVKVVRKRIVSASISHKMMNETIGYIRMSEFSSGLNDQFRLAVDDLQKQGAVHLVFDLRNNSGGMANEVIAMLDYLLPEGEIARIEGRNDGKPFTESWTSDAKVGVPPTMRYAILVNEYSASASELFSGCLRDHDLAELIGEQTFGKGSGTLTYNLADGSSVNVTNFLYYLPGGDCIEGVGLSPDQPISLSDEARYKSIPLLTPQEDTQLAAAIDYLMNQLPLGQS